MCTDKIVYNNGGHTATTRDVDERATSEDPQCLFLVGSTAMASDEVAMEQQRQRAEEADPGGVRASQEATQTSLSCSQG